MEDIADVEEREVQKIKQKKQGSVSKKRSDVMTKDLDDDDYDNLIS